MSLQGVAERNKIHEPRAKLKHGRFETLDGMRGVAAFLVILFHMDGTGIGLRGPRSAYLAVDLFFALSGFVLAYSYDKQFAAGLTPVRFMSMRVRRLFPIYYIGLVASLFTIPLVKSVAHGSVLQWCMTLAAHLVLLPGAFSGSLFPLNTPSWSLFFEFWVANLLYALLGRILTKRSLLLLMITSGAGIVASVIYEGSLNVGHEHDQLIYGTARTIFSFFTGVYIARYLVRYDQKGRLSPPVVLLCTLLLLVMPSIVIGTGWSRHVYEILCVLVFFPVLLYVGAQADRGHSAFMERIGNASYAAYAIHWPILTVIAVWAAAHHWQPRAWREMIIAICIMFLAEGVHHFLDEPIRRWIARKWPLGQILRAGK